MSSTNPSSEIKNLDAPQPPPAPASCKVILANKIATAILAEVSQGLKKLDYKPKLVGFLANGDPAAVKYAEYSAKTCQEK
jgi:methylenetetrahydrofolate dehydrogenase (NAD+)